MTEKYTPEKVADLIAEIADEISGIQVGSGYYSTTLGIDAAREAAAALMPLVKRAQAEELRNAGAIIRQYAGTGLNASSAADIIDELARQIENEGGVIRCSQALDVCD